MEGKKPVCPICGGSSYYKESGYFYCVECQTQSQELREEILEHHYQGAQVRAVRTPAQAARKAAGRDKETGWTTWEMYNFILKGMVDELILLGAKPSLKPVVLQLWARYLQKLEVAFTSKRQEKLPRLGMRFHKKDAELIYGAKIGAKKTKSVGSSRKNSSSVVSDSADTSHVRSFKKALFQSEYDSQLAISASDTTSHFEQSLKSLDTSGTSDVDTESGTSVRSRIHLSSKARSMHKNISLKTRSKSSAEKIKKNQRLHSVMSYHRIIDSHHPYCLTRQKLPALLYLALLLNGDLIQLSDILRWIREGELSFHEVTHFFPDELRIKGMDRAIFDKSHTNLSYRCLRKVSCGLAHITLVTVLPSPDWLALITRYVTDLELPAQFVKYVERLIVVSHPALNFDAFSKMLPNYEGRAMAFLIVTLKMLLGLDGKTEHEISKTAKALNRLLEEDGVQLFVWDEWVKYIEYRKSVLCEFHFPLQASLDPDGFYNPANFIRFWTKMKTKDKVREERIVRSRGTRINEKWLWPLKHTLLKLTEGSDEQEEEAILFTPSLTPNKSCFDTLKRVRPTMDIFEQDFSSASIDFMLRPKLYAKKVSENGVNLIIKYSSAHQNYKKIKEIQQKRNLKKANVQMWITSTTEEPSRETDTTGGECSGTRVKKKRRQESMEETTSDIKICKKRRKHQNSSSLNTTLQKQSVKHVPQAKGNKRKQTLTNNTVESIKGNNQKSKTLKLYVPHTHYWMLEVSYMNSFDDFKAQVWTKLPSSFQWLLSECARLLEMSIQDLYSEVLLVEKMHHFVLRPRNKKENNKLKRKILSINEEWQT